MTVEERAREFCKTAFGPFGVDIEPYVGILAELIQGATLDASAALGNIYLRASLSPAEIAQLPDWAVSRFCKIQEMSDEGGAR
jgi:hypothetical protein